MLRPPEGLKRKGYRIWTVGDDIAWMRVDTDGSLWAVNPETGFFGVAPGTNSHTNPNMVETIKRNTIYTNVLLKPDGTVWWEGADGDVPQQGIDWQGNAWKPGMLDAQGRPVLGHIPTAGYRANQPVPHSILPAGAAPWRADISHSIRWKKGPSCTAGI